MESIYYFLSINFDTSRSDTGIHCTVGVMCLGTVIWYLHKIV